jgi:3-methyladenine DNA glycosylase/8-oxoguanine DNA glycosylase
MSLLFDPEDAVKALRSNDPVLARLIERVGPCRFSTHKRATPFAALAQSITYQQLNGRAAGTIFGRFRAIYRPKRFPTPDALLETPDATLRTAGLSRAKIAAMKDLAAKTKDGTVPTLVRLRNMSDEEIVERLTAVRGIGTWTVEMLLMFRLGRPDILPVTDYGVRKGYSIAFRKRELPSPDDLRTRGERWRPFRSVAAWYLWRALELGEKPKAGRS